MTYHPKNRSSIKMYWNRLKSENWKQGTHMTRNRWDHQCTHVHNYISQALSRVRQHKHDTTIFVHTVHAQVSRTRMPLAYPLTPIVTACKMGDLCIFSHNYWCTKRKQKTKTGREGVRGLSAPGRSGNSNKQHMKSTLLTSLAFDVAHLISQVGKKSFPTSTCQ